MSLFFSRFVKVLSLGVVTVASAVAATNPHVSVRPRARIVEKIDDTKLVSLPHSHSAKISGYTDLGRLDPNTPINKMTLVLKSSDEQEHALASLLDEQQKSNHENFHQWMTPEQFGATFGVESSDMAQVTGWLAKNGFSINTVAKGARFIQFSGKSGQVEKAFHTEMHTYQVDGQTRISNNGDISIPSALTSVVRGISRLNNFGPAKTATPALGVRDANGLEHEAVTPLFTNPSAPVSGTAGGHYVGGADYAALYDTAPLLAKGINGTGVSIGLVESSDLNASDVQIYRNIFGLPVNQPKIIVAGPDSGLLTDDDVVANPDVVGAIDAEVSGAVAPMASIYYVTTGTNMWDLSAVENSAVYLVDNNLTDIISMNFGVDENDMEAGAVGNEGDLDGIFTNYPGYDLQFFQLLWEQAAAQGQSVFVTSGIGGPDMFDIWYAAYDAASSTSIAAPTADGFYSVNGYASTPFNVAVGSTEFNEGAATYSLTGATPFWAAAATAPPYATALGYIPENAWNQSTLGTINGATIAGDASIYASGGGISMFNGIPAWQNFPGISQTTDPAPPAGSAALPTGYLSLTPGPHRLLPDVSMPSGTLHDGLIFCYAGSCTVNSSGLLSTFGLFANNSASTPAMAGIQALINQQQAQLEKAAVAANPSSTIDTSGRQGNPNYYYYKIAAAQNEATCNSTTYPLVNNANTTSTGALGIGCAFHDITVGNNYIPTKNRGTSPMGFSAGTGYDLATGIGSPDAANLAAQWPAAAATFAPTTTGLNILDLSNGYLQGSPIIMSHGDYLQIGINVYPVDSTGTPIAGTPTGDVALIAQNTAQGGIGFYNITNGGCASSTGPNTLPVGNVAVTGAGSTTTGYLYTLTFGNATLPANVPVGGTIANGTIGITATNIDEINAGDEVQISGLTGAYAAYNGPQYVIANTGTTFSIGIPSTTPLTFAPATFTPPGAVTIIYSSLTGIGPIPSPVSCGGIAGDGNPYDALNNGAVLQDGNFPGLPGGTYNIYAHYTGDTTYAGSNSQGIAVQVSPEQTTLENDVYTFSASAEVAGPGATTAAYGTNVYLDSYVLNASGYGTPTGTITYNITNLSTGKALPPVVAKLNSYDDAFYMAGPGTLGSGGYFLDLPPTAVPLNAGSYQIITTYSGDASFVGSTGAPIGFVVTPATTKAPTITAGTTFITATGTATLYATVANAANASYANWPGTTLPAGTITFTDTTTSTTLGTCTLVAGACSITTAPGAISTLGLHGISGTFTDTDGNYTSGVVGTAKTGITVQAGTASTITLGTPAPTGTSFQVGATSTVIATVTPITAAGTVTLYANGIEIATGTVAAGKAPATSVTVSLTIPATLTAGTYALTATFGGSATVNASTTATSVPLVQLQNTPTVALTAPPTGDSGSGYAMQAIVKFTNQGKSTLTAPYPNLAVNFTETTATKTIALGSTTAQVNLNGDGILADLTSTLVVPGPGTITATFVGDANYATASASETVNLGATTVSITNATPSAPGTIGTGTVTLQAVVTPSVNTSTSFCVPLTTTPTVTYPTTCGTVSFYDNGTLIGKAVEALPASSAVPAVPANPYSQIGVATLSAALPTSATTHTITAVYSGDTHFYTSTGTTPTLTTTTAGFTIAANPTTLTIAQGSSGSIAITATVFGNWTGQAPLVCTGLPANSYCTFSYNPNVPPSSGVPLSYFNFPGANGSAYTGTLTITTLVPHVTSGPGTSGLLWLPALMLAGFLGLRRKQLSVRGRQILMMAILLCGTLATTACSSLGMATPKGASLVTVTANGAGSTSASPSLQTSTTFTLTVQ